MTRCTLIRRLWPWLLATACAGAPASRRGPASPTEPIAISVITTTDVHGHVKSMAQVGGYVANLREAKDDRVLWLDGGDMWQGTLLSNKFRGEPMVKVMNAIGVDAAALGNHEFDWGREPMLQRASESAFPILSANVVRNDDGLPPDWRNIKPYAVFDVGGVKVGVIGLTTLDTPTYQRAGAFPDLQFRPLAGTVKEWAPRVREAGADIIIVLAHEGGRCDKHDDPDDLSSCEKDSKLFRMVRRLSPTTVDLVIGGHSHRSINHRVGGIAVLQAGAKAKSFGRADLLWDPVKRRVIEVKLHPPTWVRKGARYAGAKVVTPQAAVDALTPYEDQVRALRAAPLGVVAARKMTRDHHAESDLGNLIADALRAAVDGAHVGLQNSGGIRADLRAGPMTYGDLYDVLPFGNQVAVLKVTGKQLMSLLRHGLRRDHGLLQSSGLRLTVDASKVGCRGESPLTEATLADGTAIDPAGVYVIATSDYLAQGGSGWTFLTDSLDPDAVEVREQMMRDATSAHLKALQAASGPVNSAEHPLVDPDRPRVVIKNAGAKRRCSKK